MPHRQILLMDYIKYACGNVIVLATAVSQSMTDELLWRGRISWAFGLFVGVLTVIKLIKDIRKK